MAGNKQLIFHGWKSAFLAAMLVICAFLAPFRADAFQALVIKDSEIKPYREAVRGFQSTCGCRVIELDSADDSSGERSVTAGADAVFAVGSQSFRKAVSIRDLPVIYTMVMPSITALSAGKVSGVGMEPSPETYFAAMTALFPGVKRIGVLSDPDHTGAFVEEASVAARTRGITLIVKTIRNPRQAPALLDELRNAADLIWMLPDPDIVNSETTDYLMLYSFESNIPVFSFAKKYVKAGAAAALTIDPYDMGAQAGEQFRLLSRGGKGPFRAEPRTVRLIVNRKVIAKMGVRTDREILETAEPVE